jgi:hypothetical protein
VVLEEMSHHLQPVERDGAVVSGIDGSGPIAQVVLMHSNCWLAGRLAVVSGWPSQFCICRNYQQITPLNAIHLTTFPILFSRLGLSNSSPWIGIPAGLRGGWCPEAFLHQASRNSLCGLLSSRDGSETRSPRHGVLPVVRAISHGEEMLFRYRRVPASPECHGCMLGGWAQICLSHRGVRSRSVTQAQARSADVLCSIAA